MRFIELAGALVDPEMVESLYLDKSTAGHPFTVVHMVSGHRFWLDLTQAEVVDLLYPPQKPWVPAEGVEVVQAPYPQVAVPCARCGAPVGSLCTANSMGGLATYPHKDRVEAWHEVMR